LKFTDTLKKNYEFRRLYSKGKSAATPFLVVYARKSKRHTNRIGFTVSNKLGNAVKRNRARRRMREVYRLNRERLKNGWDIILVARHRTLTASWKELNDTFFKLCRKLSLLEDKP